MCLLWCQEPEAALMDLKSILKTGSFYPHSMFPVTTSLARHPAMNAIPEPRFTNSGHEHFRRGIHIQPYITLLPLSYYTYKTSCCITY